MAKKSIFDRAWTRNLTATRQAFLGEFLAELRRDLPLASAADVGCGVGDFTKFLSDSGFRVVGVDGREENAAEARKRHPELTFLTADAEDLSTSGVGTFDLVLCFGLFDHLENPFRAMRRLYALTDKVLLIEGICVPGSKPTMSLFDEGTNEDLALNFVAFYPSEACLIKMMYRAGFPFVYRFKRLPADPDFARRAWKKRLRTVLAASKSPLAGANLDHAEEPVHPVVDTTNALATSDWNPWSTPVSRLQVFCKRKVFAMKMAGSRVLKPVLKKSKSG